MFFRFLINHHLVLQQQTIQCISRNSAKKFYRLVPDISKKNLHLGHRLDRSLLRFFDRFTLNFHKPKCSIQTSSKRYNPIIATIVRQVMKVTAMIGARAVRKWFQKLPEDRKKNILANFFQHRWKLVTVISIIVLSSIYYYQSHLQETILTKRRRFIAFTSGQFDYLNKIELEAKLNDYSGKLLPSNHPITQRVGRVVKRLISHNNDIDEIKKHDWTVSVIDDLTIMNAFVLASGNIFVFSGLLNFCENDNQLGIILSHEISHAILGHGIELASHAHIVDLLFIGILGFIWMLFPTDLIAFIGTTVSRILLKIGMETPYNKMLETEADEVGLILAAKACFDIREATVFWDDMAFLEKSDLAAILGSSDLPINLDFLSTHPTHNERSENLDKLIEKTLKYRNNECPPLPEIDPRIRAEIRRKERLMQQLKKEKFGVLKIQDLK